MKKEINLMFVKDLLCKLAAKMQTSDVQNIIARLGSKSPALFVKIQKVCLKVISVTGVWTTADQIGLIPAFPQKMVISLIVGAIGLMAISVGGAASLPTVDPKLISTEVKDKVIEEAVKQN